MEKEDKIGCAIGFAVFIGFILVLGLIIASIEISNGKFAKKPKETIQTYEVTYVNGLKDIVSYKVHEGTRAYIESSRNGTPIQCCSECCMPPKKVNAEYVFKERRYFW